MYKEYASKQFVEEYFKNQNISSVSAPDWNQNNPEASDYVKNRTHWIERNVVIDSLTHSQDIMSRLFIKERENGTPTSFDFNKTYIVTVDGVEYQCVPYEDCHGDGIFCLGDERLNDGGLHAEDVPFHVFSRVVDQGTFYIEQWWFIYSNYDNNTHTIKIEESDCVYHPIDEKFLPDSVKAQSDWNQNDETAPDYIKNRPFYDSRESATTEKVVVNTVAGPTGIVKLADAPLNIDLSTIKSISLESNTWLQFDNEPISAVEVVDGLYFISLDMYDYQIGIYFESMDTLDQLGLPLEWFDAPGLYFIEIADEGENISLDYSFTMESGELVQLDSKFIKEMYSDNSGDKDIVPLQTIEVEDADQQRGLRYNYPLEEGVTYNIIFDNVEYKLTANKFNSYSNKIYLGNLHLEDGIGPIDTGEPFIIVYNTGSMYAKSTIGEHTVYINGYVNDVNKVNIKYSDVVNKKEKVVFSHDNIVADGTHYLCDEIIFGECIVIFDGVEERLFFEGTDYSHADGSNFSIETGWNNVHNALWFYCDDEESHSLVIKQDKYYIKKDLLFNPNWNQNGPNEIDYVKNRTHWVGDAPKYLLTYQGIYGFYLKQNSIYGATWQSYDFALKEGDLYTIIWDNAEYTLTCKEHNNMLYLGNVNYVDMQRGGDIPFALVYNAERPGAYSWLTESTSNDHHWELLHHDNSTIHHLDSKFIKDMYYEEPDREIIYENALRFFRSKWEYYQSVTLSFNLGESYYVTWDGIEYLCDVKEDNSGKLYLGNNAVCTFYDYSFNEIIDTGEPFFITSYIMEVPAQLTSHSISIALKLRDNSIIHKIDPKYLPEENNQKLTKSVSVFKALFKDAQTDLGSKVWHENLIKLSPGEKYTVVLNNGEYIYSDLIAKKLPYGNECALGLQKIFRDENNEAIRWLLEIFRITEGSYGSGSSFIPTSATIFSLSTWTGDPVINIDDLFSIEVFAEKSLSLNELSGEFIEDGYYTEDTEILIDGAADNFDASWYSSYLSISINSLDEYYVEANGITYGPYIPKVVELTYSGYEDYWVYFGNGMYLTEDTPPQYGVSLPDTGEPFCVYGTKKNELGDYNLYVFYHDTTSFILKRKLNTPIIHKIDPKYLPESKGTSRLIDGQFYGSIRHVDAMPSDGEEFGKEDYYLGCNAIALGPRSQAAGNNSFAIGYETHAEGLCSTAEGTRTFAIGQESHAEGWETQAIGNRSHSEGNSTVAQGNSSHAEGFQTTSVGENSHAEGYKTQAIGENSHAEGYYTTANASYQHVQGKYNIPDDISAHIVGNGTSSYSYSNAHTLDWDGNAWFAGDVYVGSTSGTNKDEGSKKLSTAPFMTQVTLLASNWNEANLTQSVVVSGILANKEKQLIQCAPAGLSMSTVMNAGVYCSDQAENTLIFTCTSIPTENIVFNISWQDAIWIEPVNLITFYYYGTYIDQHGNRYDVSLTLYAEEGMTWHDWIHSPYNTDNFSCDIEDSDVSVAYEYTEVPYKAYGPVLYEGEEVTCAALIIANYEYGCLISDEGIF